MIIGTTPTHKFTLPFDTNRIKNVHIIYAKDGEPIVVKEKDDCSFDGNVVSVTLTQEDTFLFKHNKRVEIQIRTLDFNGRVLSSSIIIVRASGCLENEVLV